MGILSSRWEAEFEGHHFTVSRNEVTKGFTLEYDGRTMNKQSWSLIGTGELHGTIEHDGRQLPVLAKLSFSFKSAEQCEILVDGKALAVKYVE